MIPRDDTSNPWTRRSRRIAYENAWIQVFHDDVVRPDGKLGVYGVVHPEIPEGGVPLSEEPLVGARRELAEETGVRARSWRCDGCRSPTPSRRSDRASCSTR